MWPRLQRTLSSSTTYSKRLEKAVFPVSELKSEQKLIIKIIVGRRDVFGQLPTGFGKSLIFNCCLECSNFWARKATDSLLVPGPSSFHLFFSIVEDQVKYLRSLRIGAAFTVENKTKDQEISDGQGGFALLFASPESLIGDEKFKAMFLKSFYQKNTVAVVCDEVHTAVHW